MPRYFWLVLGLVAGAGCGGDEEELWPPVAVETGGCELRSYEWLRPGEPGEPGEPGGVGVVVSWDESSVASAETLDTLVAPLTEVFSPLSGGAQLFTMRYSTQDKGQGVEATGMVALPWDPEQHDAGPWPLIVFLHGTTGVGNQCAPTTIGLEYRMLVYLLASQGYVVVAPDFIGLDAEGEWGTRPAVTHAYMGIEQTAIGSWDMVRAARTLVQREIDKPVDLTGEVVIWGVSQGGNGALATDLLAPYYAPEMDVRAVVAMVPAPDLYGMAQSAMQALSWNSKALTSMFAALHVWYENEDSTPWSAIFNDQAPHDYAGVTAEQIFADCDPGELFDGATSMEQVLDPSFYTALLDGDDAGFEPFSCYLRDNSIATAPFARLNETPTLFVQGELDETVITEVQRAAFGQLCGQGHQLEHLECAGANHEEGAVWSLSEQLAWVAERLAGVPIDAARLCQVSDPVQCAGEPP
jgi:pimeloyl-ACP methyl ester carboxylesterase